MPRAVRIAAGSVVGLCVLFAGAGAAHGQASGDGAAGSAAGNGSSGGANRAGGVRITVSSPRVRTHTTPSSGQRFGVMVPRTTPSRLPTNFGGVRLPETTPSRIGRNAEFRRLPPLTQPTADRAPSTRAPVRGVVVDGRRLRYGSFVVRRGYYGYRDYVGPGVVYGPEGRIISTGRSGYRYGYPTIRRAGYAAVADPMLTTSPEPPEPEVPESVLDALLAGFVPTVGALELADLDPESDADLARAKAIAAIMNGHTREGMIALARIYQDKPELASRPLNLSGNEVQRSLRRAVSSSMAAANREETPMMWVAAAAVVQHVPDRGDVVERALGRAVRAGLFGRLADPGLWWGIEPR